MEEATAAVVGSTSAALVRTENAAKFVVAGVVVAFVVVVVAVVVVVVVALVVKRSGSFVKSPVKAGVSKSAPLADAVLLEADKVAVETSAAFGS